MHIFLISFHRLSIGSTSYFIRTDYSLLLFNLTTRDGRMIGVSHAGDRYGMLNNKCHVAPTVAETTA